MKVGLYTPTPKGLLSQRTAHTNLWDTWWCRAYDHSWVDLSRFVVPGNSIEVGRNLAIQRAAAEGCTHVRMLDADVYCPWETALLGALTSAMAESEAVAGGAVVPVHGGKAGKLNVFPVEHRVVGYECQYVSAAAMLIDLKALACLDWPAKTPFFARQYNAPMTLCTLDEGYFFSQHIRACGGKVVAINVPIQHGSDVRSTGR